MNQEMLSDIDALISKLERDRSAIDTLLELLKKASGSMASATTSKKASRKPAEPAAAETVTTVTGIVRRKPVWSEDQKRKARLRMKRYWADRRAAD